MKEILQKILFWVDIPDDALQKRYPKAFNLLFRDQTKSMSGKPRNIFWATNDYESLGEEYKSDSPILPELLTKDEKKVIMPRVLKDKEAQKDRSKNKAEVFTPSWICNAQNNMVDEAWFGRKDVFNCEKNNHTWIPSIGRIAFEQVKGKEWRDYIHRSCLEITCGEAPYLSSRYDATTGNPIYPLNKRVGLLDRKLRVVSENTNDSRQWLKWAQVAYKSTYGYEWHGDNLLLARMGLLKTFIENYYEKFIKYPRAKSVNCIAEIISWNLWQMDGLKGVIPNSCKNYIPKDNSEEEISRSIICEGCSKNNIKQHNGIYCYIMNWHTNAPMRYVDLIKEQE